MKKIILLVLILIIYSNLSWAQIKFEKFDWAQLSEVSAKENKIIMIEMTATWCYWCKLMEKKVFPKKEVGDFFNSNFLNAKLYDNEEAAEEFAKKYKVESFPTFCFWIRMENKYSELMGQLQMPKNLFQRPRML
jgi:thioredoxin-related protein